MTSTKKWVVIIDSTPDTISSNDSPRNTVLRSRRPIVIMANGPAMAASIEVDVTVIPAVPSDISKLLLISKSRPTGRNSVREIEKAPNAIAIIANHGFLFVILNVNISLLNICACMIFETLIYVIN
ncbi:hypothetical protein PAENIP36_15530 [Paenibacillus sp. P36]